jgi:predicted AAA+ superfamily ATPase
LPDKSLRIAQFSGLIQEMIEREVSQLIREMLQQFPAAALVGSRQCGKTTLAKTYGHYYFDLESVPERGRLDVL